MKEIKQILVSISFGLAYIVIVGIIYFFSENMGHIEDVLFNGCLFSLGVYTGIKLNVLLK